MPANGTTSAFGFVADHHVAPNSPQETFLRCRVDAQVSVLVNDPLTDIPPEFWWAQTFFYVNAFWVPSLSNAVNATVGTSDHYLGSVTLKPRRYPIETHSGEYAVVWTAEEALVTQTARQSPLTTTGPNVVYQVSGVDPLLVFDQTYADTSQNIFTRAVSYWEDP
jgi:hypothetical protein